MPGRPDLNANIQHEKDNRSSQWLKPRDGATGLIDSSTGMLLPNASQGLTQGLTWVRLDGGRGATAVLNGVVNPISPGIPVTTAVNRRSGVRQIVGMDFETAYRLFPPEVVRRMAVPLPLLFDSDALLMGKVEPSELGGLTIYVRRFNHDATEFEGEHYDLTSEVGAITAFRQVMGIVGVDEFANAVSITLGDEHTLDYVYTRADADDIALASGTVPLAALVLKAGQTAAVDSFSLSPQRYFDLRQFLNISSGTTTIFDVMMSADGFAMVDADGYMMVRS